MDKQTAFTVPMLAPPTDDVDGGAGIRASYTVEQADPARHGQALRLLIERMYGWRGLNLVESAMPTGRPDRITLVASENGEVCGTMTLGLDDEQGLLADTLYPDELAALRSRGARLCELSRLAMDTRHNSREVLGALIHLVYIHARLVHRSTDAVIEVHPRHAAFYRRMLGFRIIGAERICPRVDAPAVLMHLELSHMDDQIARFGGTADPQARTLYPYFLSREAQDSILGTLVAACSTGLRPPLSC